MKPKNTAYAAFGNANYGPTFGGGFDICIGQKFDGNNNTMNKFSYKLPEKPIAGSNSGFILTDVEVYLVTL